MSSGCGIFWIFCGTHRGAHILMTVFAVATPLRFSMGLERPHRTAHLAIPPRSNLHLRVHAGEFTSVLELLSGKECLG